MHNLKVLIIQLIKHQQTQSLGKGKPELKFIRDINRMKVNKGIMTMCHQLPADASHCSNTTHRRPTKNQYRGYHSG